MSPIITFPQIIFITLGAVLPTFAWLVFWIMKDNRPEPSRVLTLAFMSGGLAVIVLLILQPLIQFYAVFSADTVILYAFLEEVIKFLCVGVLVFRSTTLVSPNDYIIVLVTGGLGFAALENIFYFIGPFMANEQILPIFMSGGLRFIGATLLHATVGALIGICIGYVMNASWFKKILFGIMGVMLAGGVHSVFNYLTSTESLGLFFIAMGITWSCIGASFYFLDTFHKKIVGKLDGQKMYTLD